MVFGKLNENKGYATILAEHMAFIEIRSVEDKAEREHHRLMRIISERKRKIERKLKAQQDWELSKKNLLLANAQEWRKAEDLRNFITKFEESSDNSTKSHEWLIWVKEVVNEMDPLTDGVASLIGQFDIPEHLKM